MTPISFTRKENGDIHYHYSFADLRNAVKRKWTNHYGDFFLVWENESGLMKYRMYNNGSRHLITHYCKEFADGKERPTPEQRLIPPKPLDIEWKVVTYDLSKPHPLNNEESSIKPFKNPDIGLFFDV